MTVVPGYNQGAGADEWNEFEEEFGLQQKTWAWELPPQAVIVRITGVLPGQDHSAGNRTGDTLRVLSTVRVTASSHVPLADTLLPKDTSKSSSPRVY